MPLHYGSQIAEHHQVRRDAGMFDVSHMNVIDIEGEGALDYLRRVFANDMAKASLGKAVYGVLLNDAGGIIDDLIVYRRRRSFRAVANAATRRKVLDWLSAQAKGFEVHIRERADLAMIAVQGPTAITKFAAATAIDAATLDPFAAVERDEWLVARTGYTGEDGLEVLLPSGQAEPLWRRLTAAGVAPAGLAARDTLRLEAGLNLYGQDMDERTSPLEANLAWSVAWRPAERDFIGRTALARQRKAKPSRMLTGLVLRQRGVMRPGHRVDTNNGDGTITSGLFSPTLGYSIALARLPQGATGDCTVEIRGVQLAARIVKPPFVRRGKRVHR